MRPDFRALLQKANVQLAPGRARKLGQANRSGKTAGAAAHHNHVEFHRLATAHRVASVHGEHAIVRRALNIPEAD